MWAFLPVGLGRRADVQTESSNLGWGWGWQGLGGSMVGLDMRMAQLRLGGCHHLGEWIRRMDHGNPSPQVSQAFTTPNRARHSLQLTPHFPVFFILLVHSISGSL